MGYFLFFVLGVAVAALVMGEKREFPTLTKVHPYKLENVRMSYNVCEQLKK
jgi:hypothetical protein